MDEKTFFEHGDVKVTNARFISGGQTYAMSNVTSVKAFKESPNRIGAILLILIGLGVVTYNVAVGLLIIAAAAYFIYRQKPVFHIMLATAGGETSALKTHQREYLSSVVSALNEAIVHRG